MSITKSVKSTLRSSFGNVIEWYDYSLYGYFAVIISQQFFPTSSHWVSLLLTFGTFAAGYIARPLGSIFFGYLGDKRGRHFAMNIAIMFMAVPTIAMAFVPTYATIGILAPIALIIIRVMQGISAGGQFGNLMVIASEDKYMRSVGFNTSLAFSTSILGFIIASGVGALSVHFTPEGWGNLSWRIPFALGAILLIVFLFLKQKDDKDTFIAKTRSPLSQLLKSYKKQMASITILGTASLMALLY